MSSLRSKPSPAPKAQRRLWRNPFLLPARQAGKKALALLTLARAPLARSLLAVGVNPLSQVWGVDRGLEVARYYLEGFLREFSSRIRGRCLEFEEDVYTTRFGGDRVTSLDILHKDPGNALATIVADLTRPNGIPSDAFDCIICTHVLHVIFEVDRAVRELHRILVPGGGLLVAVPHISMCDPASHELWRFTPQGLQEVLSAAFGERNLVVRAYGNSLTAAGEIRGVVSQEFTRSELERHDPRFAVEVCALAVKGS